jgi:hypothetical protein
VELRLSVSVLVRRELTAEKSSQIPLMGTALVLLVFSASPLRILVAKRCDIVVSQT